MQFALRDSRADLAGEVPITAEGLCANALFPLGRLPQSIAFLSAAGNAAVVFRRHEQERVGLFDGLLERPGRPG